MVNFGDAPIYTLEVTFDCSTRDDIRLTEGDPTDEEIQAVERFQLGRYQSDNDVPVLVISKVVNDIKENQDIRIDVTERFSNDWRCPITDYEIWKVKDGNTNQEIP